MARRVLHQFVIGAVNGDAITAQALLLRRWLREAGFRSDLFVESADETLRRETRSYLSYRPARRGEVVILHHSIGSPLVDDLLALPLRFVVIYHNVTPPDFVSAVDPVLAAQLRRGREQLVALRERTLLALADSAHNEAELRHLGYEHTALLPIALDPRRYDLEPNRDLLRRYEGVGPLFLFVGRLVPNKRQDDLLKFLYHYRRIDPAAHLCLVGAPWVDDYAVWLRELAQELGLSEAVTFAGLVPQRDLVTWYRRADLYVSMSEHEGFGKPLIESMYLGLPVMAFAAAAVPGTLGGSGLLFRAKQYEALAELAALLLEDERLRERIVARQRQRVQSFLEPAVRQQWEAHLAWIVQRGGV